MDSVNQNTQSPQVAPEVNSPMPSSQTSSKIQGIKNFIKEKKKLVIGIVLILVIIVGVIIFFATRSGSSRETNPNSTGVNQPGSSKLSQVTREERVNIAAQEVVFVESQKRADGYYNYVYDYDAQCVEVNGVKTCPFGGVDMFETTNAWAALSHFAAYEISGNREYLNKSVEDIRKLDEYCAKDRAQCLWVLVQPSLIYNKTQNPVMLSFLRAQAPALKTVPLSQDNFMLAAIQVRSMFMMGDILNDTALITLGQSKLDELLERFKQEQNLYNQDPATKDSYDGKFFAENSCWVALANLYNPSVSYPNIKIFLDNGDIIQNFQYFNNPIDIQPCIEAYFVLGEKSQDDAAYDMGVKLQAMANSAFFDGKETAKKVHGKGGYLINKPETDLQSPGFMVLTDVSYASYLQNLELK